MKYPNINVELSLRNISLPKRQRGLGKVKSVLSATHGNCKRLKLFGFSIEISLMMLLSWDITQKTIDVLELNELEKGF